MGWMRCCNVKPAGFVGILVVGDRATGAVYARIDGRLYPALNMTSARLAIGNARCPPGLNPRRSPSIRLGPWSVSPAPPTTSPVYRRPLGLGGLRHRGLPPHGDARGDRYRGPVTGGRAEPMASSQAVLASFQDATYVIWGGQRSRSTPPTRDHVQPGPGPRRYRSGRDLTGAVRRATGHRAFGVPVIPGGRRAVAVGAGRPGGGVLETRDSAGPRRVLRAGPRRGPEDQRLRGGSDPQRERTSPMRPW